MNSLKSIALEGGKIYATLSKAGKKIEFNDCLIAATARSLGMRGIVTMNTDHFNRITVFVVIVPENIDF
ncbi:MAG: type II toxin-antitoxin system VapC family toxin [Methanoregula sp.]